MPQIASLAEFNRNQTKMLEKLYETKQPIYLTRNGAKAVVVMDAQAYDNSVMNIETVRQEEMRVYRGLMRGMSDYVQGKTLSKDEMKRRISATEFQD